LKIDGDSTCHEVEARVSTGGDYKAELSVRALKQKRGLPGPAFERRYDERKSRSGRAEGKADVVPFAVQRIANPGLVDRFTRGLSLTEPAAATFYTGAARGYVDDKRFDQMAGELKA
jgi:2,4-dienoyl-CoA reductase-like NADH-dependent reductase (Old Yellow Enzyme family)